MSAGDGFKYSRAFKVAESVMQLLAPCCKKIHIAGSLRRQCDFVHDIDLVVSPIVEMAGQETDLFGAVTGGQLEALDLKLALIREGWKVPDMPYPRIIKFEVSGIDSHPAVMIPVELYITEPDGSNFGALAQMRTGSARFNQLLAERANKLHLTYSAGRGIYRGKERVDDGTERGIFTALGMQYIEPEARSGDWESFHRSCA